MQLILGLFFLIATGCAIAQQYTAASGALAVPNAVQRPSPQLPIPETATLTATSVSGLPDAPSYTTQRPPIDASTLQPGRISGVIADHPTVGAGRTPLSTLSKGSLNLATTTNAGYSSLIFVGGAAGVTRAADQQQQSDGSTSGSGKNCWRSSVDKVDGNGWFNSLLSMTSKSGHYCALGEGGFWKRGTYAATQAFVAQKYDGAHWFNAAEVFSPSLASGFSTGYNSYQNYQGERLAARYASAVGREALRNMFREFWPDISTHMSKLHGSKR